jgi:hypothetical protein
MNRAFAAVVSVLAVAACAPGETTRTAKNDKVLVPAYSCVGTRISQSKHCREVRSVSHPSEVIQTSKPTAIADQNRRKPAGAP